MFDIFPQTGQTGAGRSPPAAQGRKTLEVAGGGCGGR